MTESLKLRGRIVTGVGEAAFFTRLDWVQEQCEEKLGFKPWPGTLNIEIVEEDLPVLEALQGGAAAVLVPPDPQFCEARVMALTLSHLSGALIVPAEDVRIHGKRIVEILAPVNVKETLGLSDGDRVTLILPRQDASGATS